MGRGKIEIKRIENTSNRQVTYSKRRNGLIKKAKEISVLCDAKVSLIIFASSKKMHEYCSPSTKMTDILDEYHRQSGKRLWDTKHENLNHEVDKIKKENDNLQIQLRHLKGEDITSLNYRELMALEEALENGLACVRDQEMEVIKTYRRNHIALQKMLEEENRELNFDLQQHLREMTLAETAKLEARDHQYRQRLRDGNSHHMPFSFRVQPIQPNLQDRD